MRSKKFHFKTLQSNPWPSGTTIYRNIVDSRFFSPSQFDQCWRSCAVFTRRPSSTISFYYTNTHMYICIYIHTCICIYIHVYIYTHVYIYICRLLSFIGVYNYEWMEEKASVRISFGAEYILRPKNAGRYILCLRIYMYPVHY